jgi:hypothetical protein
MVKEVDLFSQINNAVLDLQGTELQTFERPLRTLARLLHHPDLEPINGSLTESVDFDAFMAASESTGGQMLGSHQLAWPENSEQVLGLTLVLIDRLAADSRYAINIGHQYFYSGSKVIAGIHSLTRQVIIPFVRDYRTYVMSHGNVEAKLIASTSTKVFIVHGHDGTPKAEIARFIEKLGLEAVILHERPNKGRTLITKFQEEAGTAGFAVVLMTPDDLGKAAAAADLNARARQNVVFELGFFIGKLGPERVAALVKGDVEKPSDFDGVVYRTSGAGEAKAL